MKALKEVRTESGITQQELANLIKCSQTEISSYEKGLTLPILEDILIMENHFNCKIDWPDDYPGDKRTAIKQIAVLMVDYPINAVAEFIARNMRREQCTDRLLDHYARIANNIVSIYKQ